MRERWATVTQSECVKGYVSGGSVVCAGGDGGKQWDMAVKGNI